jgi:hypothetical protein
VAPPQPTMRSRQQARLIACRNSRDPLRVVRVSQVPLLTRVTARQPRSTFASCRKTLRAVTAASAEPLEPTSTRRWKAVSVRPRLLIVLAVAVFAGVAATVGYLLGTHGSSTHLASGYAYASPYQISATSHGWAYDIPLTIRWRDGDGGWHEGSRPACLPASTQNQPVRFAWVPVDAGSVTWRVVAWVDCTDKH